MRHNQPRHAINNPQNPLKQPHFALNNPKFEIPESRVSVIAKSLASADLGIQECYSRQNRDIKKYKYFQMRFPQE